MQHTYTYADALAASERVSWRVEDLIGGGKEFDYSKPFMPEALVRVGELDFLNEEEKLKLNQIRGHAYLTIFGLVEEFILPFVVDHARPTLSGDDYRTRAMMQFATEEAKHIHLFKEFRKEFERGFGSRCDVIGPPEAVAEAVLGHHPIAVALTILHIEWMTQRHYVESVKDNTDLDEHFKSLLRHHWMEEAQHAKLDTLMIEALAADASEDDINAGIAGYAEIGGFLDEGMRQQTEFDLQAFERATGRILSPEEHQKFLEQQHQSNRWIYLGTGMTHPNFLDTVGQLSPAGRAQVEEIAPAFC